MRRLCTPWGKVTPYTEPGFVPTFDLEIKCRRQTQASRSLSRVPPSSSEAAELHAFCLRYGQLEENLEGTERVWIGETRIENCMLMFPQERK